MRPPPVIIDEVDRLAALRAYAVLDTGPEPAFDRLTRTAAAHFGAPIALVSLVDDSRQWFKSRVGLAATQTDRAVSFCAHAIAADEVFVVPDAQADDRFHDNPLVTAPPRIRFYAGAPITTSVGYRLGTLCVVDTAPRAGLDGDGRAVLRDLAGAVLDALELRRAIAERERHALAFLARAGHELRTPLAAVTGFAELLALDDLSPLQRSYAERVVEGGRLLAELVDDALAAAIARDARGHQVALVPVADVLDEEIRRFAPVAAARGIVVEYGGAPEVAVDGYRTGQAVGHLLDNAVVHSGSGTRIAVVARRTGPDRVRVEVADDGGGLAADDLPRVFEPFFRGARAGDVPGSGLGLTLVKSLVEGLGGAVGASSVAGTGSTFWIEVPAVGRA